jgi:hypothetical protein
MLVKAWMQGLGVRGLACSPDRKPLRRSERLEVKEEWRGPGGLAVESRGMEKTSRRDENGIDIMEESSRKGRV